MSSVPLSDGCKSPMKMHGTSSCGCASSVITSIESKRRLLSQAVAVVTTCDNSKVAVHFCFGLWPRFYRWARNSGWIKQVMCGGCIIETQFFWCFLIVELYVSWHSFHRCVDGQFCPWRRLKQEAMIWKKSSNPIWWKRDICWCCSIPLCQGLICLSILSDESAWAHVST